MKTRTKIILSSTITGTFFGVIAGWYSIPTMFAEWLNIYDNDFIDNYINDETNPYLSTVKGTSIWGAIGGITTTAITTTIIKTVDGINSCWGNRSQEDINNLANEENPLLAPQREQQQQVL